MPPSASLLAFLEHWKNIAGASFVTRTELAMLEAYDTWLYTQSRITPPAPRSEEFVRSSQRDIDWDDTDYNAEEETKKGK